MHRLGYKIVHIDRMLFFNTIFVVIVHFPGNLWLAAFAILAMFKIYLTLSKKSKWPKWCCMIWSEIKLYSVTVANWTFSAKPYSQWLKINFGMSRTANPILEFMFLQKLVSKIEPNTWDIMKSWAISTLRKVWKVWKVYSSGQYRYCQVKSSWNVGYQGKRLLVFRHFRKSAWEPTRLLLVPTAFRRPSIPW